MCLCRHVMTGYLHDGTIALSEQRTCPSPKPVRPELVEGRLPPTAIKVKFPAAFKCETRSNQTPNQPPNTVTPKEVAYFRVLRAVELNQDITQPQLAKQLGISMGKANYLIKALVDKGMIKVDNFRQRGDKLNKIAYLLTPEGLKNRIALTRNYLARKETEYEALRAEIDSLRTAEAELPEGIEAASEK